MRRRGASAHPPHTPGAERLLPERTRRNPARPAKQLSSAAPSILCCPIASAGPFKHAAVFFRPRSGFPFLPSRAAELPPCRSRNGDFFCFFYVPPLAFFRKILHNYNCS
ncbi:hypothetical protein C5Q97_14460 [Victivallales bacterium CCUG 44730]|nr:hypothetical protein C5Q97_14460 [Victivallales bacterium CCUG 44730]HBP08613.1 hypothetical protein [Lentisphaeria bacterium]